MKLRGLWWWIDRWRKSSAYIDMTLEEQGAYRNLLDDAALRGGPLPNDEQILAKACGDPRKWRKVRPKVIAHFTLGADGWHNETLDDVLRESERRAAKQADYRRRRDDPPPGNGAVTSPVTERARSGNNGGNKINLLETDTDVRSGSSFRREGESRGETPPLDVEFRQFQAEYPRSRRKGGPLVEQAYLAAAHLAGGWAVLLDALRNHIASEQWQNPKHIPGMDSWLENEQWRQRFEAPVDVPNPRLPKWAQQAKRGSA